MKFIGMIKWNFIIIKMLKYLAFTFGIEHQSLSSTRAPTLAAYLTPGQALKQEVIILMIVVCHVILFCCQIYTFLIKESSHNLTWTDV